jgi:hypothetical protein
MRKLTESIVMLLALAACGSDAGTEVADSSAPANALPEAGTTAPAASTTNAGKPATTSAGSGAASTADAGSKSVAPSSSAAGSAAARSGGTGGAPAADGGARETGAAGAATEPAGGAQGVPCEVSKALAAACQRCHGTVPANGAPMSLVTLEDFQTLTVGGKPRVPKWQAALNRMNGTKSPPMPPATSPITDEHKQTLLDWLGDEAPAGDACD